MIKILELLWHKIYNTKTLSFYILNGNFHYILKMGCDPKNRILMRLETNSVRQNFI